MGTDWLTVKEHNQTHTVIFHDFHGGYNYFTKYSLRNDQWICCTCVKCNDVTVCVTLSTNVCIFWTLHICIQLLNIYIHVVIYTESFVLLNSARYYGSWSYTDTYYYMCSTSSSSLTGGCTRYSVSSSVCNSDDQVGLWCMTQPQAGKYIIVHIEYIHKKHTSFCMFLNFWLVY